MNRTFFHEVNSVIFVVISALCRHVALLVYADVLDNMVPVSSGFMN
jgi:hypothetical protein